MIAYKVVRRNEDGELGSAFASFRYVLDKPNRTDNGTPLLAFATRRQAMDFAASLLYSQGDPPTWELWECEVNDEAYCVDWLCSATQRNWPDFWKTQAVYPAVYPRKHAPSGTIACEWIRLTEKTA
jgi:hypothetical protein